MGRACEEGCEFLYNIGSITSKNEGWIREMMRWRKQFGDFLFCGEYGMNLRVILERVVEYAKKRV